MKVELFWKRFRIILLILIISPLNRAQFPNNFIPKKGGVCFRTDDNQTISEYLEYASIFNTYNQKFSFAINLGLSTITPDYIAGLQQLQAWGHEMMDHTPRHMTNRFSTILDPEYFRNHPGVHRISGNRIELKHASVNINYSKRSGIVNIQGNKIISSSGEFSEFLRSDCYLYFPALDKLVFISDNGGWIDSNNVIVQDFWNNNIDLGVHQSIMFYNFDYKNIHLLPEAIKALGEESVRLSIYYNLNRPYTWIQPGGYFPQVYKGEVKQGLESELGFKGAGVFSDPSLKVFNEYNPNNDRQFGMSWGDFNEDVSSLQTCKQIIADRIAKHHVLIGHSHFNNLLDGWPGFLDRTDKLIQWCVRNNIPIRTYTEWSDILYRQTPYPNENIFPPLNVDLDGNKIPDGYNSNAGEKLDTTDGSPSINDYCFNTNKAGEIFSISNLAGLEKGQNDFGIWTKGASGNFIEVIFKLKTSFWSNTQDFVYKFPAENSEWTYYDLAQSINGNTILNIPSSISLMDVIVRCSNYSSGIVKVSGMKFAKSFVKGDSLSVTPPNQSVARTAGSTSFLVSSNIDWVVNENESWLSISPTSGTNNGTITTDFTENNGITQRVGTITITGGGISRTVTVTQQRSSGTTCLPGTVSYWKLDETSGNVYADFTGTNNASSTNTPTPIIGRVRGAQQFNGTSNRITAPANDAYNWSANSNFTFEAWMKHPNVPTPVKEFIIGRKALNDQLSIWLGFEPTNEITFSVRSKSGERGLVAGPILFDDT